MTDIPESFSQMAEDYLRRHPEVQRAQKIARALQEERDVLDDWSAKLRENGAKLAATPPGSLDDDAKKLLKLTAPVLGGLFAAIAWSALTTRAVKRGAKLHPSPVVRKLLRGSLAADVAVVAYAFGKTAGAKEWSTEAQRIAKMGEDTEIKWWRYPVAARDGVAVGLAVSRKRGVPTAVAAGAALAAVQCGLVYSSTYVRKYTARLLEQVNALKPES